ncbi:FIG146085: 3'-to-5' oligoribonuclease A, Bacillus type [hydrothermal vent metagenome]|uniref:FIG146085: 3'-to-5' oligoribonuclease A, Bacillus type n=1 Tax=hydrothermal vent metagenome TaxID=652676 RepID=A0A3B1D6Q9_9ZZZZ
MKVPEEIVELVRREQYFTIASHINPEGDALGASLALALALRLMHKDVRVFNSDGVPYMYNFLPSSELVETVMDRERLKHSILLVLDCNDLERVGLKDVECKKIVVIDHHQTVTDFGHVRWIEPESPAAGLMIYNLLRELDVEINTEMAVNLYAAIAVDTGTFRYENTTPEVLRAAAGLVEAGVNPGEVSRQLYESWSVNKFRLFVSMLNTVDIVHTGNINSAIATITLEMFKETGADASDTENFINFPRMIESVDISAMFREVESGCWKASLRSKGNCDVSLIASHFGGGGHKNAAGYKVCGDIEDIKRGLLEAIQDSVASR